MAVMIGGHAMKSDLPGSRTTTKALAEWRVCLVTSVVAQYEVAKENPWFEAQLLPRRSPCARGNG
ncbi:hypothetical protein [Sulfitobacter sp. SK012]|uniref:hypothetical protein n=1 Tax=Sulfitobacter sp. SK012 TaxID=1389005 RepID=UPI0013B384F8|nr:hypothetical protein [Sulfitobacter sp. SK012]